MCAYHLGWASPEGEPTAGGGGKLFRAGLAIWACEACGGEPDWAVPAAAAVELVHNFTLVHDDIQDGDTTRRHRPTVWAVWGRPRASTPATVSSRPPTSPCWPPARAPTGGCGPPAPSARRCSR